MTVTDQEDIMSKKITIKRILSALAAFMIVCSVSLSGAQNITTSAVPENASYSQKLAELEKQEQEIDEKMNSADSELKNAEAKKAAIDEKITVVTQKITTINEYSKQLAKDIAQTDANMRAAKKKADDKKAEIESGAEQFKQRLRAMYMNGSSSYTSILFSSTDFFDMLMRSELISRVAQHDNDAIDALVKAKNEYEANQKELENEMKELKEKSGEYKSQLEELNKQSAELESLSQQSSMTIDELNNLKSELQQQGINISSEKNALTQTTTTTSTTTTTTTTTRSANQNPKNTTTDKQTQKPAATKQTTTQRKPNPSNPSNGGSSNSGSIATVIATAQSMVGGSYVWGAASQYAADCSGLTMYCYSKIGISLPHNAAAQSSYGTAVSYSNMQPGDLIFFGSPAYHVALYVGDGMMIHAENSNTGIVYSYVDSFALYNPISAIRRIV